MKHTNSVSVRPRRSRPVVRAAALLCVCAVGAAGFSSCARGKTAPPAPHVSVSSSASPKASSSAAVKAPSAVSASPLKTVDVSLASAEKPLWIDVSIEHQTLTVYDAENRVVESWLCSTGSPGYDTPRGTFHVYRRGKSFFSPKYQEGAYYYVAFYEDYYIHSVPFDQNRVIIPSVASDLGHEDSHGCVHLSIANSKWVYENIPDGTRVAVE